MSMAGEMREHLLNGIIPFWQRLKDEERGGFFGFMGPELSVDKKAVKGCILNSRILWFFSNAALSFCEDAALKEELLKDACHAYRFMKDFCMDKEYGGVYWAVSHDGIPEDTTKHIYNQAFAIYALSSYYDASQDVEALKEAMELFFLIEEKGFDEGGYKEALDRTFAPAPNDKLSENGVMADRTMNTLLHIYEAYTELYRVSKDERVKRKLMWILDVFRTKVYNPALHRQEVFFDNAMNSIIDLHSYGHDIETAWLLDRGLSVLGDAVCREDWEAMVADLVAEVYRKAYYKHSLANECECGRIDSKRVWWVQAEGVVGFYNEYQKHPEKTEYAEAARDIWNFIKEYVIDKREGSEWFMHVDENGAPDTKQPIVEPWKCPYHNGRMCMEIMRRMREKV